MKKLFGILCVFLSVLLTACNVGLLSERSGSIDFSIPAEDMVTLAENYSARSPENKPDGSYIFLVQIKGDRGYYRYQTQTVKVARDNPDPWFPEYEINDSEVYLSKNKLDFSFSGLPINQTYTVMFDMLINPNGHETPYSVFSGRSEGVAVSAGQASDVGIKAMLRQESNLVLRVEYENSDEPKELRTPSYIYTKADGYNPLNLSLSKKNGKLYEGEDLIVKDIYYVLDSDTNYPASAFNYSIEYFDNGHKAYKLSFKNNKCSIKNFLIRKLHDSSFSGQVTISNGKVKCNEALARIQMDTTNNLVASHSEADTVGITFIPKKYKGSDNEWAYVASFQLNNTPSYIDTSVNPIAPGDTVVIVLNISEIPNLQLHGNQLYYKLSSDPMDGDVVDGEVLFKDNNCINHKDYERMIVIPLNFIKNPNDYLILFEDFGTSQPAEQNLNCSFTYYIFPSDMHVFAFGVGAAYEEGQMTDDYRYEFNASLGKMTLSGGDNVTATIRGNFCTVDFSSSAYIGLPADFNIVGELYDGGPYHVNGEDDSFHPLSDDQHENTKVQTYEINDIKDEYSFVFKGIKNPVSQPNDFKLLCTADCDSPDKLLLVQYFDLSFSKD